MDTEAEEEQEFRKKMSNQIENLQAYLDYLKVQQFPLNIRERIYKKFILERRNSKIQKEKSSLLAKLKRKTKIVEEEEEKMEPVTEEKSKTTTTATSATTTAKETNKEKSKK